MVPRVSLRSPKDDSKKEHLYKDDRKKNICTRITEKKRHSPKDDREKRLSSKDDSKRVPHKDKKEASNVNHYAPLIQR